MQIFWNYSHFEFESLISVGIITSRYWFLWMISIGLKRYSNKHILEDIYKVNSKKALMRVRETVSKKKQERAWRKLSTNQVSKSKLSKRNTYLIMILLISDIVCYTINRKISQCSSNIMRKLPCLLYGSRAYRFDIFVVGKVIFQSKTLTSLMIQSNDSIQKVL